MIFLDGRQSPVETLPEEEVPAALGQADAEPAAETPRKRHSASQRASIAQRGWCERWHRPLLAIARVCLYRIAPARSRPLIHGVPARARSRWTERCAPLGAGLRSYLSAILTAVVCSSKEQHD